MLVFQFLVQAMVIFDFLVSKHEEHTRTTSNLPQQITIPQPQTNIVITLQTTTRRQLLLR